MIDPRLLGENAEPPIARFSVGLIALLLLVSFLNRGPFLGVLMCFANIMKRLLAGFACTFILIGMNGCSSLPGSRYANEPPPRPAASEASLQQESSVVLFALGLLDTGYRFGGKNPSAGFDCSGMISYIFQQAAGMRVTGSAADIAQRSKPVDLRQIRPGDLLFFNTQNRPFSHVGLYIGSDRFIHAPSSAGTARVRTESLKSPYFASRLEAARSLFD